MPGGITPTALYIAEHDDLEPARDALRHWLTDEGASRWDMNFLVAIVEKRFGRKFTRWAQPTEEEIGRAAAQLAVWLAR